jgi:hypothetical protein
MSSWTTAAINLRGSLLSGGPSSGELDAIALRVNQFRGTPEFQRLVKPASFSSEAALEPRSYANLSVDPGLAPDSGSQVDTKAVEGVANP